MENHKAKCYWVTGLPGAGKSHLSRELTSAIKKQRGINPIVLDGDAMRDALGMADSGFDLASRKALAYSYGKFCRLLTQQGHVVICATVSMFDEIRVWNRHNIPGYYEIFLNPTFQLLQQRDQKGLYSSGKISEADLGHAFQLPKSPDLTISNDTSQDLAQYVDSLIRETL